MLEKLTRFCSTPSWHSYRWRLNAFLILGDWPCRADSEPRLLLFRLAYSYNNETLGATSTIGLISSALSYSSNQTVNKRTPFKYTCKCGYIVVPMGPQASKSMVTFPRGNMRVRIPPGLLPQRDHSFIARGNPVSINNVLWDTKHREIYSQNFELINSTWGPCSVGYVPNQVNHVNMCTAS